MAEEFKPAICKEIENKKKEINTQLEKLEKIIFDKETKYLENTISTGNILKGYEHYFNCSKAKYPTKTQLGKRPKITNSERLFSQTTFNNSLLKDEIISSLMGNGKVSGTHNGNSRILKSLGFMHRKKKKMSQGLSMKKNKPSLSENKSEYLPKSESSHQREGTNSKHDSGNKHDNGNKHENNKMDIEYNK